MPKDLNAVALQQITAYLKEHMEECPAALLMLQSGRHLGASSSADTDPLYPDITKVSQIKHAEMGKLVSVLQPSLSETAVNKLKTADKAIVSKLFWAATLLHQEDPLPTRQKSLFSEMLQRKNSLFKAPPIVVNAGWTIEWPKQGIYEFTGQREQAGIGSVYTHIGIRGSDKKVALPARTFFTQAEATIRENWSLAGAKIDNGGSTTDVLPLFEKEGLVTIRTLMKGEFRQQLQKAESDLQAEAAASAVAKAKPAAKKRKLTRVNTDQSIPSPLKPSRDVVKAPAPPPVPADKGKGKGSDD
eukprot:6492026-Amphidinium_carterae.2